MKNLQYTGAIVLVGMGILSTSVFADSEKSSESHMDSHTRIEATHQNVETTTMKPEVIHTQSGAVETTQSGAVETTQSGAVETTQSGVVEITQTGTLETPEVVTVATPKVSLLPTSLSTLIDGKLRNMADDTSRVTWLSNINDKIDILVTKVTSQKSKDILSELKDLLTQKIDTINGGVTASSLLNGLLQ